jgi:hypothetical protein
MTKKHLKNIEKYNEKVEEEAEKFLEKDDSESDDERVNLIQEDRNFDKDEFLAMLKAPRESWKEYLLRERNEEKKKINISLKDDDLFYATKIYNTLFELKRQYPNKYQFVRNTDRMKREWKRWSQEQFDNDYVYCYTKWFGIISKVNQELIGKFVF